MKTLLAILITSLVAIISLTSVVPVYVPKLPEPVLHPIVMGYDHITVRIEWLQYMDHWTLEEYVNCKGVCNEDGM